MIEIVLAAICIISAIGFMLYQQIRIDELKGEAELWRRRYVEAFTRDMTDAIEADLNQPESLPRYIPNSTL